MCPRPVNHVLVWVGVVLLVAANGLVSPVTAQTEIENAFPDLSFSAVTDIQAPPDSSDRLFVLQRAGRIRVFEADASTSQTDSFLDIRDQVDPEEGGGLLGLAFDPDYVQNGRFFVFYTTSQDGPFRSVVSRFTVSESDSNAADPASEEIVLSVEPPYTSHNGGQLQFGPDGFLYVGLGDGGNGEDPEPEENGQDPTTLLGSMLRLDVDLGGSGASPDCGSGAYEVPEANPFVGAEDDKCGEIYAYGFRNPYRYSFGPEGRLWVADVGQTSWEEIDWVEAGGNYGWNVMEGTHCYDPSSGCDKTGLELPVYEYGRSVGYSITGGYVSTGGCGYVEDRYVYGDFGSGRIWALSYDEGDVGTNELLLESPLSLTTFGVGPDDRLYFAGIFDEALYQFDCSTLPVELTSFRGRVDAGAVHLTWETASETNSARFVVQHRAGEQSGWKQIGHVESNAEGGTTTEAQAYQFTAEGLSVGTHQFRLKQVDIDGSTAIHGPIEVNVQMQEAVKLSAPAPNPTSNAASLSFAVKEQAETMITLYNTLGQQVATVYEGTPQPGERQRAQVDAGSLPSGTYFVRLQADGQTRTRRLTVVR